MKNKSLRAIAKEIGISSSYLSEILKGIKGCNEETMKKIKKIYNLEFEVYKPRYRVKKGDNRQ